jgi:hypothetical protein
LIHVARCCIAYALTQNSIVVAILLAKGVK